MKVLKELGVGFNCLWFIHTENFIGVCYFGEQPLLPGKLRQVVVREQRVVGWGLLVELGAGAELGGPAVALPARLCFLLSILSEAGRAGVPLGFWLVHFQLHLAV